jgi:predicted nucleic acid-binding protein
MSGSLVLDCSATLAFVLPDEISAPSLALLDHVAAHGAWVPSLWGLEVANALSMAVRRGRIAQPYRNAVLHQLGRLDIQTDPETSAKAWETTLTLADRHGLTLYDAAYLELSLRRFLRLATLDAGLLRIAVAEGVEVYAI